jgi:hypothetical protein
VGSRLAEGHGGWDLEVEAKSVNVLSPVDGEVIAHNPAVLAFPGLVNRDPYGDGWLVKVRAARFGPDSRGLLRGESARVWMNSTEETLRRLVSPELGTVLQDGGAVVSGIARSLSPGHWDEIARTFLHPR